MQWHHQTYQMTIISDCQWDEEWTKKISPFFFTFTKDIIINCFRRVGYTTFTREYLSSPYIRHELLDEGQENTELDQLVNEYDKVKLDLKKEGFNVQGIFDAKITIFN